MKSTKFLALLLAVAMALVSVAAFAEEAADVQTGVYTVFNLTGEKVTSVTITDPQTETTIEYADEDGIAPDEKFVAEFSLPAAEDGHNRLVFKFVTESGYEGVFETLSIETAPISMLAADALTGATQISFTAPDQVGVYTVYNVTGEKVTSLTITDPVTETTVEYADEDGIADGEVNEISFTLPGTEDGHNRLVFKFVTESGYEGVFETLSIETAPISMLAADALTGATQISFFAPVQTGVYTVFNLTGEKVTSVTITDPQTKTTIEYADEDGIAPDEKFVAEFSLPAAEDGHNRLVFKFVTESGYEGVFETLSIETAPISMLAADALTGATQISFTAPDQVGVYTVYNVTGEKVTSLTITDPVTETTVEYADEDGIADGEVNEISFTLPGTEDGHNRLVFKFVTESGYEGVFETLSIETAPISMLAADALTGATQISFFAPAE